MNFYRRHLILLNSLFFLLFLSGLTYTAFAWSNGKTGQTQDGCTCHGSANSATKVTLTSGSGLFTVEPGSTTKFTVAIDNSSMVNAGLNVGVKTTATGGSDVGSLTAGTGTKIENGEVTHNGEQSLNSGKFDFTFEWKAPAAHGEYWIRGAANAVNNNGDDSGDQWNRFTTQKIIVAGVTVTAPNGGENWCVGTTQTITWKSNGIDNVKLEYSTNSGTDWNIISASTAAAIGSFSWAIPQGISAGTNNQIRISDAAISTRNDLANSTFALAGQAIITTQPIADETCTGQAFTLTVVVSGSGHKYQWRRNGSSINGATQSTYTRSSAILDDAGDYDCVITTSCGDQIVSAKAKLDVFKAPSITTQPAGKSGCDGTLVTLTAVVEGEFTTLQWRKNGQPISGANNSTYVINSLKASDEGDYTLRVTSDKCGNEISSSIAKVVLNRELKFVAQPKSINSCEGSEAKLTAQVDGSINGFQWYKNDTKITGASSREYTIPATSANDAGNYKLELIGSCGKNLFSEVVKITINSAPTIGTQPANKEVFVDESVTLSVSAQNPGGDLKDLNYQWKKNGNNITNANTNSYTINKVALADAGKYSVEVKNACNLVVNSTEASLKVIENNGGPAITANIGLLDFGDVKIGEVKSETSKLSITNSGDENLIISAINISGTEANAFTLILPTLPLVIAPESSINISIDFKPAKLVLNQAIMTFVSNAVNNATIELRGNGIDNGTITTNVSSLSFGSVVINEEVELKINIENPTTKNITITEITTSSSEFNFTPLTDPIIEPNTSREIVVKFLPIVEKDYDEVLTISTDDNNTLEIPLTAKAIESSVWDGIPTINSAKSYPNPSEGTISLELNFDEAQKYEVSIVDLKGMKQIEYNNYSTIGKNMILWNGRDFSDTRVASGSYLAIIKVGKNVQTLRFVIQ